MVIETAGNKLSTELFDDNFIKNAVAVYFGIDSSEVKIKNYTEEEIMESIDWLFRKDEGLELKDIVILKR